MIYKFSKSHTVLNALNCLSSHNHVDSAHNELNIKIFHAYTKSVITLSADFEKHFKTAYKNDAI